MWEKGADSYLQMIYERLVLMKELLSRMAKYQSGSDMPFFLENFDLIQKRYLKNP